MKRLLALLLGLLLLFCVGCKKESPELGEFYEEDGIWQNTLITAELRDTDLTAPVTKLSYALIDNCDFRVIYCMYNQGNDACDDLLERYVDGFWRTAPIAGNSSTMMAGGQLDDGSDPREHKEYALEMECAGLPAGKISGTHCYKPLEAGEYRLRILYRPKTDEDTEGIEIPQRCEAVIYFTVK